MHDDTTSELQRQTLLVSVKSSLIEQGVAAHVAALRKPAQGAPQTRRDDE